MYIDGGGKNMIKIGDFANLFNVSIKTVRYYESMGLIVPKYVDIYTGYRYFDEENIKVMQEILALKKLGFTLEEIHNFDKTKIKDKIEKLNKEKNNIENKIANLEKFSLKGKEVLKMNEFVNDAKAVGKWHLLGISENINLAKREEYIEDDYNIKELYLLPNGENYWIIHWTRGIIYINEIECPYEIIDNKMYITIKDPISKKDEKIATYYNVNHQEYDIESIKCKDDTNIALVEDKEVVGIWNAIDFINNPNSFNPDKLQTAKEDLALDKLIFEPSFEVHIRYKDNNYMRDSKYTKGYITNLILPDTLCKYDIQTINNKKYLIVEWKSGDYVYGKVINGYYVLERQE